VAPTVANSDAYCSEAHQARPGRSTRPARSWRSVSPSGRPSWTPAFFKVLPLRMEYRTV